MESRKEPPLQGTFECELCGLRVPYSYYGQKPPNGYSVTLLEDSYVMRDPFTPDKDKFLVLGSECIWCRKRVCAGTDCSLFYKNRFCLPCANSHSEEFPWEIRQALGKRTPSTSQPSRKGDSKDTKKKDTKKKQSSASPERVPDHRRGKKQKD
ncbi:cysteine-rich DPF motif domain-containing protein 1 [Paroedura picta]|uniref:cysteine-rich DPF motif domain-containing protein 1 n=1 Tax=Paroedura picta TaxID=143630 RepID=UPI004056CA94